MWCNDMNRDKVIHIKSIKIKGFRGIRNIMHGALEGFKGINIFIGRNNSGKSTIIEAIYLVSTLDKLDALGRIPMEYIIKRRGWYGLDTLKDIIHRKLSKAEIEAVIANNTQTAVIISKPGLDLIKTDILYSDRTSVTTYSINISFNSAGSAKIFTGKKEISPNIIFIDWNVVREFGLPEKVYSFLLEYGGKEAEKNLVNVFKTMYSELEEFKVLPKNNKWVLSAILTKYSIPFYLLGDGIKSAFIYIALLNSVEKGIILIEEPELHQHIGSMEFIAEAIIKSRKERENQVFITTHSLEFIDLVLRKAKKYDMGKEISIYRISLKNGELKYRLYSYEEALKAREEFEVDLRV